jgi:hypothetical protein
MSNLPAKQKNGLKRDWKKLSFFIDSAHTSQRKATMSAIELRDAIMQEIHAADEQNRIWVGEHMHGANIGITVGLAFKTFFDIRWTLTEGRLYGENYIYVNGSQVTMPADAILEIEHISKQAVFVAKLRA